MPDEFPYLLAKRLTGTEHIHDHGTPVGRGILHFWQWSASNIVGNTLRGWFAEFLVAVSLGEGEDTRKDWEAFDLAHGNVRIEVKSSAYIQSWSQRRLYSPRFSIRRARAWDPETNMLSEASKRNSELYVFCVHEHSQQESLDPLDVSQWGFYVVPTSLIEARFPDQKSVGIGALRAAGFERVSFGRLGDVIRTAASSIGTAV